MDSKGKILIIDDEVDLAETMSSRLESEGYDVRVNTDGLAGIETAKQYLPDIIMLDIMMPGIDGFETLKRIKADGITKHIPVVMFSCGSEEEEWARRSLTLGSAGYVVKPFETSALIFTVQKIIKKGDQK